MKNRHEQRKRNQKKLERNRLKRQRRAQNKSCLNNARLEPVVSPVVRIKTKEEETSMALLNQQVASPIVGRRKSITSAASGLLNMTTTEGVYQCRCCVCQSVFESPNKEDVVCPQHKQQRAELKERKEEANEKA